MVAHFQTHVCGPSVPINTDTCSYTPAILATIDASSSFNQTLYRSTEKPTDIPHRHTQFVDKAQTFSIHSPATLSITCGSLSVSECRVLYNRVRMVWQFARVRAKDTAPNQLPVRSDGKILHDSCSVCGVALLSSPSQPDNATRLVIQMYISPPCAHAIAKSGSRLRQSRQHEANVLLIRVYGANDRARKRRPNRQGYCLSNVLYNNNNA